MILENERILKELLPIETYAQLSGNIVRHRWARAYISRCANPLSENNSQVRTKPTPKASSIM